MKNNYVIKTALVCFFSILIVYGGFMVTTYWDSSESNSFEKKLVGLKEIATTFHLNKNPIKKAMRIELEINDDIKDSKGEILEVYFDNKSMPLAPADGLGHRGTIYLQVDPGKHTVLWKVKNNEYAWPRSKSFKKTIYISKDSNWTHLLISGKDLTIS
jgi:hypothetical protein